MKKYKLSITVSSTEPLSESELRKLTNLIVSTVENCKSDSGSWYKCKVESGRPV